MAVEKGFFKEEELAAISHLRYTPSISKAESSVLTVANGMKAASMLDSSTNPEELSKRAFIDLEPHRVALVVGPTRQSPSH